MAVTVPSLCFLRIGWDQQLITGNRFMAQLYLHLNRTWGGYCVSAHRRYSCCQAAGHRIAVKVLGRRYCKKVLKPTQPMDKSVWTPTAEKNLPNKWNSSPVYHCNLELYQLNRTPPTCGWSSSSPGTPWQRRSGWPCRAAQQRWPPRGCTPAGSPAGSRRACTLSRCKKGAPRCTHLPGRSSQHVNKAPLSHHCSWFIAFCCMLN